MADPAGFTAQVLVGLAQLLASTDDALTYRPPGAAYKAGEAPITFGSQHPTANASLCITPYDDVPLDLTAMHLFVQVRTRWPDYLDGLAQTDRIRTALHDRRYVRLGEVTASRIRQTSFLPLGADGNGRHEWTQNYRLLLNRPAQQPTP